MNWRLFALLWCVCFAVGGAVQVMSSAQSRPAAAPPQAATTPPPVAAAPGGGVGADQPADAAPADVAGGQPAAAAQASAAAPAAPVSPPAPPAPAPATAKAEADARPEPVSLIAPVVGTLRPDQAAARGRILVERCTNRAISGLHRHSLAVPRPRVDVFCRCYAHHVQEAERAVAPETPVLSAMHLVLGPMAQDPARDQQAYAIAFLTAEQYCPWAPGTGTALTRIAPGVVPTPRPAPARPPMAQTAVPRPAVVMTPATPRPLHAAAQATPQAEAPRAPRVRRR